MFDSLTTSETWALLLIVVGIATFLASRLGKWPIRVGYEGGDEDDRLLGYREAAILGALLVGSGVLVFVIPWVGWTLVAAALVWAWRVAR